MLLPLAGAKDDIERARVVIESHIRDSSGAYRTNAIQISEHLSAAVTRIEALENIEREVW